MQKQNNLTDSLAHTKWNCKYHIVFAPKYRRKVFYEDKRLEIREILRECFSGYGLPQGQECTNDISEMGEYEICV